MKKAAVDNGSDCPTQKQDILEANVYCLFSSTGDILMPRVIRSDEYQRQQIVEQASSTKKSYWTEVKQCKATYGESSTRIEDRSDRMQTELLRNNFREKVFNDHPYFQQIQDWKPLPIHFSLGSDFPNPHSITPIHENSNAVWIDNITSFRKIIMMLEKESVLTFDSESYNRDVYRTSIICTIQISTKEKNFVIDALNPDLRQGIKTGLKSILENEAILKVGSGLNEDVRALQRDFEIFMYPIIDLQLAVYNWLKFNNTKCIVCNSNPCHNKKECKQPSYQKIVSLFYPGKIINKMPQRADWTLRPLHPELVLYASLDTSLAMKIWIHISNGFGLSEPLFENFITAIVEESKVVSQECFDWTQDVKIWSKFMNKKNIYGDDRNVLETVFKARDWVSRALNRNPEKLLPMDNCMEVVRALHQAKDEDCNKQLDEMATKYSLPPQFHAILAQLLDNKQKLEPPIPIVVNEELECSRCHKKGHPMGMCAAPRVRTEEDKRKDKERYRRKRRERRQQMQ